MSHTSTALHSGGSLTQAQEGLFGSTGNGVLTVDLGAMSAQAQGLAQGVQNKHIRSAQGYNLGGSQTLFKGNCPEAYTVAQCTAAGLDPGTMWRGDSYHEVNTTLEMRTRYDDCKLAGETDADLQRCAAPNETDWNQ